MIYDDNDDDEEQLDKMKRLEAERNTNKNRRSTMSAFSKASIANLVVDLTSDQISYGIRPSTVVQLAQIKSLNEFNKALPKKKQD